MKLDLTNQNLRKIESLDKFLILQATLNSSTQNVTSSTSSSIDVAIFDNNLINKLDNLDTYGQLKQVKTC